MHEEVVYFVTTMIHNSAIDLGSFMFCYADAVDLLGQ